MFPIFAGSHMLPFAEGGTKAAFTIKAGGKCNFFYWNVRTLKQKFCRINSGGNQLMMGCESGVSGKNTGKVKRAHVGKACQLLQCQGILKMFINIGTGTVNYF